MAEPTIDIRETRSPEDRERVCYEVYDSDTGGSLGYFDDFSQARKRADDMNAMIERETGKRLDRPSDEADVE